MYLVGFAESRKIHDVFCGICRKTGKYMMYFAENGESLSRIKADEQDYKARSFRGGLFYCKGSSPRKM